MASQMVLVVKNLPANAGQRDAGLIPGWGRRPGGGNGNPLQYSCLENPVDRGAWWATVHRVTKSQTWLKQLGIQAWWAAVYGVAQSRTRLKRLSSSSSIRMHPGTVYFNFRMNESINPDCKPVTCENWTAENLSAGRAWRFRGPRGCLGASLTCRLILGPLVRQWVSHLFRGLCVFKGCTQRTFWCKNGEMNLIFFFFPKLAHLHSATSILLLGFHGM